MKPVFSLNARLTTRVATVEDVDAIGSFLTEMLVEFGLDLDHYGVDNDLLTFADSYRNGYFGLIEEDGNIKGTFALFPMGELIAELRKMYLHPDLRGKGIGNQLMSFIEDVARDKGFRRLELETASSMHAARTLYAKKGYVEIEPIHNRERCQHRYFKQLASRATD